MLAIGTNLIVRYLTGDHPKQSPRARKLIDGQPVFAATTVILEVERVLRSTYGYRPADIARALRAFAGLPTVTGDVIVLDKHHFEAMKDGAIVSNSGHFNVEINIPALEKLTKEKRRVREFVEQFELHDGRRINLLGDGRLINLAAAEGHPAAVMDMSFANQALAAEYMVKQHGSLKPGVMPVPERIDREIARLKLASMNYQIDTLTDQQARYLASWEHGT
jgi:adenosylhomocysteinase